MPPAPSALIRRDWVILAAIVLLGVGLRLYRVDWQSAWPDEHYTLHAAGKPVGAMIQLIVQDYVHPPLHYLLLYLWMKAFGFGVFQARLLSVVFGSLAVIMIYLLARRLFDRRTGILAALVLAVSQLAISHSQEARPYALTLLLTLCSIYLFLMAAREKRIWAWWGFAGSSTLMLYSHYYAVFVLISLFLISFVFRKRYAVPLRWWLAAAAVLCVAYIPWLASGVVEQALMSRKLVRPAGATAMTVRSFSFFSSLNWFNNGKWSGIYLPSPLWTYPVGGLLFTLPALLAILPLRKKPDTAREAWLLLAVLWLLPMGLVLSLGLLKLQYDVRYVAFSMAPYYVLVAHGFQQPGSLRLRRILVFAMLAYSLSALHANYFIPFKGDYRGACAYLASVYQEGDCCSFMPARKEGEIPIYWLVHQRNHPGLKTTTLDDALSGRTECSRIWLVWDYAWFRNLNPDHEREVRRELETGYSRTDGKRFFGLDVSRYLPRQPSLQSHISLRAAKIPRGGQFPTPLKN